MAKQQANSNNKIPANNFAAHPDFNQKNDAEFAADQGFQVKNKKSCKK